MSEAEKPGWVCWEETENIPIMSTTGTEITEIHSGMPIWVVGPLVLVGGPGRELMVAVQMDGEWYADSDPQNPHHGTIVPLQQEDGIWKSERNLINKAALAKIKFTTEEAGDGD